MGCDIHLHTEVKINGKWHHYSMCDVDRNYALFGKMAGVRLGEGIKPISRPRGLPKDMSFLTKYDADRWEGDGHSHSYLTASEIHELLQWVETSEDFKYVESKWRWESDQFGYLFGNGWAGFVKYPDERPKGLQDIRWVFWFDN